MTRTALTRTLVRPLRLVRVLVTPLWIAAVFAAPVGAQPEIDLGTEEQQQAGKVLYDKWCAQCHGEDGDGRGVAAPYLDPRPRDFTAGKYKFRTTPNGTMPTDADIARVIREGVPFTGMPGFPDFSAQQTRNLVYYLKTFARRDFEDPQAYAEAITVPDPPTFDRQRALEEGLATYQQAGCKQCHGDLGRGDGGTAPTLRDDWGYFIRAADLTRPWTFRGGGSREDVFRTLSTGLNGTPMASFDALPEEQRWLIVDWIVAHADGDPTEAPYRRQMTAVPVDAFELPADPAAAAELFADAPTALFPVVGQIMEPGRQPHPSATSVEVQAIYDRDQIAFRVRWHDMAAETRGHNRPDLEAPPYLEVQKTLVGATGSQPGTGGDAEEDDEGSGGSIWGDQVADGDGDEQAAEEGEGTAGSIWGDQVAEEEPAGETPEEPSAGSIWDQPSPAAATAEASSVDEARREFSDAVAIQLPTARPEGIVRPYFLFGDDQNPVDLWFMDLAEADSRDTARLYTAHGSDDLAAGEGEAPRVRAHYRDGQWSVVFAHSRSRTGGLFQEDTFVPIAFSVWDGFQADRGNRRGLTRWYHVYLEPRDKPPVVGPMIRAALIVLALELLIVFWVRRRRRAAASEESGSEPEPGTAPQEA